MLLYPNSKVPCSKLNDLVVFVKLVVKVVMPSPKVGSHQTEFAITIIEHFEH